MKKFLPLILAVIAGTLPLAAQLNGDGYYRVQNYETARYVYITDNKGHVDPNTTSVDALAIQLWKGFDKACCDPATVLYFQNKGGQEYDILAQGTGINQIIDHNVTIRANNDGTYFAYGRDGSMVKYLGDANSSDSAEGTMSTEATGNRRKWWIKPINDNQDYFFGIKPSITSGGKYYEPMYASFPMKPKSSTTKIYVVTTCNYGMAVLKPVEGVLPGGTACVIECASVTPYDNRMDLGGSATAVSGNLLSGVYFENHMKTHLNLTPYDPNTMRVLGTLADGSLGFVTANIEYLPANKSYLRVAAGSPKEIRIVTQQEYDQAVASLPSGVTVTPDRANMYVGQQITLSATISPANASDKSVTWTSSNVAVATVDEAGNVKAVAKGTAEITARTVNGLTSKCTVTVNPVYPETVTVTPTSFKFYVGDSYQLTAAITPADVQNSTLTWTSSDASVVSVDNTGKITGVKAGTATVTVATADGKKAQSVITVNPVYPTSIALNVSEHYIYAKESYRLTATLTPADVKDPSLVWTTSAPEIATVDNNGYVIGVAPGKAVITATSPGGASASCSMTIMTQMPESVKISFDHLVMEVEDSRYLSATVEPAGSISSLTWSTSNPAVVTVSSIGKIEAVGEGEAVVTVKTANDLEATCSITVLPKGIPATSVTVVPSNVTVVLGETVKLSMEILPENVTNPFATWSSNNPKIATIDSEGNVTAVSGGTCIITAQCGSARGTCVVTVTGVPPTISVSAILLDKYQIEAEEGTQFTLTATVLPDNATDKTVNWRSDNETVATVTEDGLVSVIKPEGTATITAEAADGSGVTAKCVVIACYNGIFSTEGISAGPVSVYTIEGVLLYQEATADDIRGLAPGFYIIGKQKVLVK